MSSASYPPSLFGTGFNPYTTYGTPSVMMNTPSYGSLLPTPILSRHHPYLLSRSRGYLHETPMRRGRLTNRERKEICEYALKHPGIRQEFIGSKFGIDRSTVSKVIKGQAKWLNISEENGDVRVNHRPMKFANIESEMEHWLDECRRSETMISNIMIRAKALEVARSFGIPDDKFKASFRWISNFKRRRGISNGTLRVPTDGAEDIASEAIIDGEEDYVDNASGDPSEKDLSTRLDVSASPCLSDDAEDIVLEPIVDGEEDYVDDASSDTVEKEFSDVSASPCLSDGAEDIVLEPIVDGEEDYVDDASSDTVEKEFSDDSASICLSTDGVEDIALDAIAEEDLVEDTSCDAHEKDFSTHLEVSASIGLRK
ncbi:hypothetical protein SCHPADRAFT_947579 [Schizopora paradoxa]|uniref:HTH CENPB-type domain-containing protein n=1 Tax=Schizopora paradoxa TaxID=27342 RepID=A0A0H2RID0_9AGAM|nr:hypothetical protein SCHPADRAFT_947579 [Schizopora paradoxa]